MLGKSGKAFHPIVTQSGDAADRVPGMVFAVTPEELAAADSYEVDDYARVETTLASGHPRLGLCGAYIKIRPGA